jgi:hypothetical protein
MISLYGPENLTPEIFVLGSKPFIVDARTLGSAIEEYSREFHVEIRPYDGSDPSIPLDPREQRKYFFYERLDESCFLVDIHVQRGKENICPKQNLDFSLLDGDEVHIGMLVC